LLLTQREGNISKCAFGAQEGFPQQGRHICKAQDEQCLLCGDAFHPPPAAEAGCMGHIR
jgi:hypothetical protein